MTFIYPNLGHIYRRRTTHMLSPHSSGAIWYLPLSCNCMICVRRISRHDQSKNNNKLQIECIIDIFTWKPIQWSVALAFRWHKQQELRLNTALITNLASATPSSVESHLNCVWWLTFGQYAIPCAALRHSRLCQNIHTRHSSELNNNNNVWTQFGSKTNHENKNWTFLYRRPVDNKRTRQHQQTSHIESLICIIAEYERILREKKMIWF